MTLKVGRIVLIESKKKSKVAISGNRRGNSGGNKRGSKEGIRGDCRKGEVTWEVIGEAIETARKEAGGTRCRTNKL